MDIISQGGFSSLSNQTAVRLLDSQFHSELKRFQSATSTIETSDAPPLGCLGRQGLTPFRFLYNEDFPEVNRTLFSLLALKWLVADDYDSFTSHQPDTAKLTLDSFKSFRNTVLEAVSDANMLLALVASIVVGDVGKNPDLAEDVKAAGGDLRVTIMMRLSIWLQR